MSDSGFVARYESACPLCRQGIKIGDRARWVDRETAHFICPQPGAISQSGTVKGQNNLGKVACDAYGNVMMRMTENGWEEVDEPVRAERDVYGNQFPKQLVEPPLNVPLMERARELMDRIGRMGDYVAPDHSGEWWDDPTSDDVWRDGW